jgi:EmrB/QacA subfamily drug resistance transporter
LVGFAGFVVSSALCGLSPSVKWLIVFRGIQAMAAAMLFANSPAIITRSFPGSQRGRALGLQATMTYLGLTVGPLLGGLLAGRLGWRSVFYINVPVGLLGLFLSAHFITRDRPRSEIPRFDLTGAGLFFVGLFTLLLALNQGHAWGWSSAPTVALLVGGASALTAFLFVERRRANPMLDLSLFRRSAFSGSVFSALASYVASFSIVFLLPFYLIQGRGLDPAHAGLVLTAQPLVMMAAAPLAGMLSDRFGSRMPSLFGLAVLASGLTLLSLSGSTTPLWQVAGALAICGLGIGAFAAPNNSRLMGAAPRNQQGIAAAVLAAARNIGMVFGVGFSGAIYTTVLARSGPGGLWHGVSTGLQVAAAVTVVAIATSWLERDSTID